MNINEITAIEANELLASAAILVDVREMDEVANSAFEVAQIENIPFSTFDENYSHLSRNQKLVIACHLGIRSHRVAQFLIIQGWDEANIFSLEGGMEAWKQAKLPYKSGPRTFSFAKPSSSCGCESNNCC